MKTIMKQEGLYLIYRTRVNLQAKLPELNEINQVA